MCGIAGWANLDAEKLPSFGDEAVLSSMCDAMLHRGPDSEGLWLGAGVALGMRRLSIIDLKTGDQPVWSEDRSVVAIMNGEIYNFPDLRRLLEKAGHKFLSNTDTEVIPHLYEEYGADFVEHLNGMFAIALWDIRKRKLIIVRDRFGEKPLYYGVFDDKLIFASEAKVLLSNPNIKPELNLEALENYLSFDYVPAPLSIYKGIKKLPAAHRLILENGKFSTDRYWNLSFQKNGTYSVEEESEKLRELLADSVNMRMISDVPLGVLLSGGIDSSTVAAFAQQSSSKKIKTFSIGFEEDSFDESKYAREVARHLGTEHFEDKLSVGKAANLITEIGKWLDEPLSDGSILPTFLLSRFVRDHVTVALGGDGGDEIFAGYPMYYAHKLARVYDSIPRFVRSGLIEPIVRNLPVSTNNLSFDYKAKRFVSAANYDTITRHHAWFGSFSPDQKEHLLASRDNYLTREQNDIYRRAEELLKNCDAENQIERMQFLDMNFYLAEDILTKVDRASMAVSLEVRAPFLDHHIAEFAAGLPADYKLRGSTTKYILKKAVENLLPKSIAKRPKKGFGIPIAEWLKTSLNPLMHDLLSSDRILRQNLFDHKYVRKMILEHEKGVASHHKQLWTLLVFQLWYNNFLDK